MQEPVAQLVTNGAGRSGTLAKRNISVDAIRLLPAEFVKRHRIIPLEIEHGVLHIATADPGNQRLVDDVRLVSGLEVKEFEAPASEILEKIAECYQITVEQMVENLNPEAAAAVENRNLHDIEVMANEPTVINLVNVIISTALRERASDTSQAHSHIARSSVHARHTWPSSRERCTTFSSDGVSWRSCVSGCDSPGR